ncbi:hypothetical protein, partial [Burkholderia latens]|uniref:hypothetical protein n=1 Tax=Burkholderia latens TaxID=488446 RepID=UPI001BAA8134
AARQYGRVAGRDAAGEALSAVRRPPRGAHACAEVQAPVPTQPEKAAAGDGRSGSAWLCGCVAG